MLLFPDRNDPSFSLPEVLPLLMPLAYRKPRPPLNRFSNRSYLQRVHAKNALQLALTRPPDALSFPRLAATQRLSVPHNIAFARRMGQQTSPSFRISFKKSRPAPAPRL